MITLKAVRKAFSNSANFLAKNTLNLFYRSEFLILLVGITVSLIILSWLMPKQFSWTGFGEDSTTSKKIERTVESGEITSKYIEGGRVTSAKEIDIENFQSGKTLWDWLGLLGVIAIPVVLFEFQQEQQKQTEIRAEADKKQAEKQADVERQIAATNLREEALRDYIDKLAELLIDKKLKILSSADPMRDAALDVARARTLSVLRRLDGDGERKGSVVRFLIDAELIESLELLKDADLSGAYLSGIKLSKAKLMAANLEKAYLLKAELEGANLERANLIQASLNQAILNQAILIRADLSEADLSEADLSGADLSGANPSGANLEKAKLEGTNLEKASILQTNLSKANLSGANLSGANLSEANLSEANLSGANLFEANLFGTDLSRADLSGANLSEAVFLDTDLSGACFIGVKNLTPEQIKDALGWEEADLDPDLREQLGLPVESSSE